MLLVSVIEVAMSSHVLSIFRITKQTLCGGWKKKKKRRKKNEPSLANEQKTKNQKKKTALYFIHFFEFIISMYPSSLVFSFCVCQKEQNAPCQKCFTLNRETYLKMFSSLFLRIRIPRCAVDCVFFSSSSSRCLMLVIFYLV